MIGRQQAHTIGTVRCEENGMSNGRYVVVKGRFGMGGRIAVMLSAYRYALETDRELIVDWNDYAYYSPSVGDVFQNLFEWPPVSATPLVSLRGATVFPDEWQSKLVAEFGGNEKPVSAFGD